MKERGLLEQLLECSMMLLDSLEVITEEGSGKSSKGVQGEISCYSAREIVRRAI